MQLLEVGLEGHAGSRRSALIGKHVRHYSFDLCNMESCPAAGDRISVRIKTDDGIVARKFPIPEHVIKTASALPRKQEDGIPA